MAEQEKLLPCPFCGKPLQKTTGWPAGFRHDDAGCFISGTFVCEPHLEEWNTRVLPSPASDGEGAVEHAKEVAKLRAALVQIANWREWPRAGPVAVLLDVEQIARAALKEGEG